jgi:hypothetical protein
MAQAPPRAWWEDVEHLREAAERRIAERESAQREARGVASVARRQRGDDPSTGVHPTGRFRRQTSSAGARPAAGAVAGARAATATATARVLEEPEPELVDVDFSTLPDSPEDAGVAAEPRPERPTRREELSRLAQEQARAAERAAAGRARSRAGASAAPRRTIEIRGVAVPAPALTAVPDASDRRTTRRRRPSRTPAERFASRPDRIAQWAFLLGLFLIALAALSGH